VKWPWRSGTSTSATIAAGKQLGFPLHSCRTCNGGIDSVAFCFAFLYIASAGAGMWSADAAMGKK
jgi:uncharacterized membrane protein YphA (DoxX/SURF4 family)